jgi:hypothetical protein
MGLATSARSKLKKQPPRQAEEYRSAAAEIAHSWIFFSFSVGFSFHCSYWIYDIYVVIAEYK